MIRGSWPCLGPALDGARFNDRHCAYILPPRSLVETYQRALLDSALRPAIRQPFAMGKAMGLTPTWPSHGNATRTDLQALLADMMATVEPQLNDGPKHRLGPVAGYFVGSIKCS